MTIDNHMLRKLRSVVAGELEIDGIRRSELRDGQLDQTPPMRIAIAVAESIIGRRRA